MITLAASAELTSAEAKAGLDAVVLLAFLGFAVLYCLPLLIAGLRRVPGTRRVALVNLLLGWTVAGWIAALVMAVRSRPPPGRL